MCGQVNHRPMCLARIASKQIPSVQVPAKPSNFPFWNVLMRVNVKLFSRGSSAVGSGMPRDFVTVAGLETKH